MIVWGGWNGSSDFNTGGRYNPATDSWVSTSITNVPVARHGHAAVWTGNEMIVWGGYPAVNTGGRYNPTTDSWTATSTTNAPTGRLVHASAVWTGTEMIVWGGWNLVF
jgi:N-acetylneuraminic acid mutarotase